MLRLARFLVVLSFILIFTPLRAVGAGEIVIGINPQLTYQTFYGWLAADQAGQFDIAAFPLYKDYLFDQAVNDLGINRLRVGLNRKAGPAGRQTGNGFDLNKLDGVIEMMVLPMQQLLRAKGEKLYIDAVVVGNGYAKDPNGYAQAALEALQNMKSKYGLLPDSWEVALEPDNFGWESPSNVANALIATGNLFRANGYNIPFVIPANTDMTEALHWFDGIMQTPGAAQFVKEFSYHRYAGVSTATLQAIASRAQKYGLTTAMLEHMGSDQQDLYQDLTVGRNSSWGQYALAYRDKADGGGLYYMVDDSNPTAPKVVMGSRTKFLRQYFKFIRPGAVRIDAQTTDDHFAPVAFVNRNGKYVVVVNATGVGSFSIQGLPAGIFGIKYTTNQQYDADWPDQTITSGGILNASIPDSGVVTIYLKEALIRSAATPSQSAPTQVEPSSPSALQPTTAPLSVPLENPTQLSSSAVGVSVALCFFSFSLLVGSVAWAWRRSRTSGRETPPV